VLGNEEASWKAKNESSHLNWEVTTNCGGFDSRTSPIESFDNYKGNALDIIFNNGVGD
jgi:hypothetical protein